MQEDPHGRLDWRALDWKALTLAPAMVFVLSACSPGGTSDDAAPETTTAPSGSPTSAADGSADTAQSTEPSTPKEPTMTRRQATALLARATADGDLATVKEALANRPDLESRNDLGRTPLVVATKSNRVAIARALLQAGADPNAKDDLEDSAFLYAGAEGLDEILELTLAHGADVSSINRYGGTALIPASEHAHVETVRILIAAGVPVNHVNNLSWTALHEAIVLGDGSPRHVKVVEMLLEAGADPAIPDGDGVLPRRLASDRGYQAIVDAIDRAR
ncbi:MULTISPECIES: ankyrin repeat domain-containing protein [unclassified Nocardioides]|uniref:ankyrin repeat domain-containing protein n=1 Tax=unclassified Nocardioides TaxID=2615069 RepID=UPI000A5DECAD|nr:MULTISPECIES: ankyrin repeat domain-containing protein [unclassified Nocardioides]